MIGHNSRDGDLGRIRTLERPPHEVHPAQGKITDWSHAEMPLAGRAKCSLGDTDRGTYLGEVQWPTGIRLQEFYEPRKDGVVTTASHCRFDRVNLW